MVASSRAAYGSDVRPRASSPRRTWPAVLRSDAPWVAVLCLVAFVAHAINAFHFPAFQEDEGIYAAQGWSVLREFRLTPYAYTYDHAPAGWIFESFWMLVTGGPETFGGTVISGRVFVLLLHVASVLMLYRIARKLGCGVVTATIATLLFSLSPLALVYQRMYVLDNIMIFWVLLSLNLLLDGWGRLSRIVLSGMCFGIAVLTKETAIFLIPAVAFIVLQQRWDHHGRFAVMMWLVPAVAVISLYPLYAALKGELFPAGAGFGSAVTSASNGSASLLEALEWQAQRSGSLAALWDTAVTNWFSRDALLIVAGTGAVIVNLLAGFRDRRLVAASLLGALPLIYLARGGIIFDFYILFAIPFLALNIGVLLSRIRWRPLIAVPAVAVIACGGASMMIWTDPGFARSLYEDRPAAVNQRAVSWIKANIPSESYIIARDDFLVDLREDGFGGRPFPNVHSHWKVAADPAVREDVFHDDWRRVDYLILTPNLKTAFEATDNEIALDALNHSSIVREWEESGYSVQLRKVDKVNALDHSLLDDSYEYLERRFDRGGAFVDDKVVSSEAQAYALLRAVWSDRQQDFDRIWKWTSANLQRDDGLLSWKWENGTVVDESSATDADTDAALALLFAGKRWDDATLIEEGTRMVRAIWEKEVAIIDGTPYVTAGDWATEGDVVVNPSYLAPYAYRVFAEVDREHDWHRAVDSSYDVLFSASGSKLGVGSSAGLPPDWVGLDPETAEVIPVDLSGGDDTNYGYDAARAFWRVAVDREWSGDGRAAAYLERAAFLADEVDRKGYVGAVYTHAGDVVEEAPSMVGTASAIAALDVLDEKKSSALYAGEVVGTARLRPSGAFGDRPHDIYAQEWAWFAVALYANQVVNLWDAAPATGGV